MKKKTGNVLFPLFEESFTSAHLAAIACIKRTPNHIVVVNKKGRATEALDEAGIRYFILASCSIVTPKQFILTAFIRLWRISFAQFLFVRQLDEPIDVVHFFDMTTALSWSGTCRMFRLPYVISVNAMERFSKYASMVFKEARFLTAATPFVKETTPARLQKKMYVVPPLCVVPKVTGKTASKERRALLKQQQCGEENALLLATDVAADSKALTALKTALTALSGKEAAFVTPVVSQHGDAGKTTMMFEEWKSILSCCDAFVGLSDCTPDALCFFAALAAEIPVFTIRRGTYVSLVDEMENGVFLDPDNEKTQAETIQNVLSSAEKTNTLKQSQNGWYGAVYKKTMDFMREMYDSV